MGKRKGFTLTELLVCIAILAVLLAMLVPAIARVRGMAMNTVCTSRLRAARDDRRRALREGFQVHVPKPVEPEELASVVASLTGRTVV